MSRTTPTPGRDAIHPDLRFHARLAPRRLVTPATLPLLRALTNAMAWHTPRGVEVVAVTADVTVRLHRSEHSKIPGPALLWLHGGGYVMGTAAQDDRLCRRYARALGATVAAVDYRLAPEHPYPTPLDDCYCALAWLARLPTVDPRQIVVGGASGGGGLAAALALLARDRGEIDLAAQLLAYPMLDDRTSAVPRLDNPGYRMWNHASNDFGWSCYLDDADPDIAVPARVQDLGGLPPTWLGVGTLISSTMKTWPMRPGSPLLGSLVTLRLCLEPFTPSTCWGPKPLCHRDSSRANARLCVTP